MRLRFIVVILPVQAGTSLSPASFMDGKACKFVDNDFSQNTLAHAFRYASNHAYNGYDHVELSKGAFPNLIASSDGRLKLGKCTIPTDTGTWHVQRVGPFQSVGGFDWWQLSWDDVLGLKDMLRKQDLGFNAYYSGTVYDNNGEFIELPPIHVHHVHVTASPGVSWETDLYSCLLHGKSCPDFATIFEHHGDYQLPDEEGGAGNKESFGMDHGKQGTRRVYSPLRITGEFNDVRPAGSPAIKWWYQLAIRLVDDSEVKQLPAISMHYAYNPFKMGLGALTHFGTLGAPVNEDSVYYYTAFMPFDGTKISIEVHAHQTHHQMSVLFEGSPKQLGLGQGRLLPRKSFESILTKDSIAEASFLEPAGGANNQALLEYVMKSAAASRERSGGASPRVICKGTSRTAMVLGKKYDRKSFTECVEEWTFKAGTQYTSISFHGAPDLNAADFAADVDFLFPSHTHWFIRFIGTDDTSHFTAGLGSVTADSTAPALARMDVVRTLLFGTAMDQANWMHHYILIPAVNLIFFLLSLVDSQWTWFAPWPVLKGALLVLIIVGALGALLFLWLRPLPRLSANGAHKKSQCLATFAFLMVVLAASSTAAFVLTVFIVPYDLHLLNDIDAALLSMPSPGVATRTVPFVALVSLMLLCAGGLCGLSLGVKLRPPKYAYYHTIRSEVPNGTGPECEQSKHNAHECDVPPERYGLPGSHNFMFHLSAQC